MDIRPILKSLFYSIYLFIFFADGVSSVAERRERKEPVRQAGRVGSRLNSFKLKNSLQAQIRELA